MSSLSSHHIHRAWYVVCGWCGYELFAVGNINRKETIAQTEPGWKYTKGPGWLCPDCADLWEKGHRP